jgi:PKD repeat protein
MKSFTKYILLLFLLFLIGKLSIGQDGIRLHHSGEIFLIENGMHIEVNGGLESTDGNTGNELLNLGNIYVSDSIVNHGDVYIFGTLPDTLGHVYLDGHKNQKFDGKAIYFSNLHLDNSADTLFIQNDTVYITKKLNFIKGKINLESGVLHLKRTPYLWGNLEGEIEKEDTASHVFGYPGYLKMERPLTLGQTYNNLHGTGFKLSIAGNLGNRTEIRRYHNQQTNASNGSIDWYYNIHPKINDDISDVGMTYLDTTGLNGNTQSKLAFYYSTEAGLSWRDLGGTIDSVNNSASNTEVFTINSKTRITLSEDSCDALPYVNIPKDTLPLCSGQSIFIRADSVGDLDVYWSNGLTGVDSILVNDTGLFWVKVISAGGCVNFDSTIVVTAPDPVPGFYVDPHCLGDSAMFVDTSKIVSGTINYSWDFGDPFSTNDTSTSGSNKYLYTKFGTFNVKLNLESNLGCKNSITRPVVVLPIPTSKFASAGACEDSLVAFTNTSTVPGNGGITYRWEFGDGDTSIIKQAAHAFEKDTTFRVKLYASAQGCTDSSFKNVTIYPNPVPRFVFANNCPNEQVKFTDSSAINSGTITYSYNFGNSITSAQKNPSISYASSGNYTVSLALTSDKNCKATFKDTVIIHPKPTAGFTTANACSLDSASFTNSTIISSGAFSSFWSFGDGDTLTATAPKHVYIGSGAFKAKLRVVSDSGCADSVTKTINVYPNPSAAFSVPRFCEGDQGSFTNSSSIVSGTLGYRWYFGNGDTSVVRSPSTIYATAGTPNVLLVVTSVNGCIDSLSKVINVNVKPILSLGTTIATCGSSLELNAGNLGATFVWSNAKRTQKVTVINSGSYSVTVTNAARCNRSDTVYISLNTAVKPQLGPDISVCDSIELKSGYGATASTALWNGSSTDHTFSVKTSGTYSVTVTDPNSCVGSDTVIITVNTSPSLNLGGDIIACSDSVFNLTSSVTVPTYKWSTGAATNQISPTKTGLYKLTVTDANSCTDIDEVQVTFNEVPAFELGLDKDVCDSIVLEMNVSAVSYKWKGGSASSTRLLTNSDTIWAKAISAANCVFTDTISVVVNTSPNVDLGIDTTLCAGNTVTLDAGFSSSSYKWSTITTAQTIEIKSSQNVRVTVTDTNSCVGKDSILVTINPVFNVDLGPDEPLCKNSDKVIFLDYPRATFNWNSSNSFASLDSSVLLTDTGSYWVEVIDSAGCRSGDTIQLLYTNKGVTADFTSVGEIIIGDTVAFINLSFPKPDNQVWIMHDGFTNPSLNIFYPYFVAGDFEVKLAVSNSQCSDTLTKTVKVKKPTRNASQELQNEVLAPYVEILDLGLYPNPTDGVLNVHVKLNTKSEVRIQLFDLYGHLQNEEYARGIDFTRSYDVTAFASGMYFIRCIAGQSIESKKFIKIY